MMLVMLMVLALPALMRFSVPVVGALALDRLAARSRHRCRRVAGRSVLRFRPLGLALSCDAAVARGVSDDNWAACTCAASPSASLSAPMALAEIR
jgi:hypothetical protein